MGSRNRAHCVRRWLVVEKNAAAAVDLQVDEAWRKHRAGRHHLDRTVTRALSARRDVLNDAAIDHDDRLVVPSKSIENTVRRNCQLGCSGVFGCFQTHRLLASSLAG
jgi:hypothetical protein